MTEALFDAAPSKPKRPQARSEDELRPAGRRALAWIREQRAAGGVVWMWQSLFNCWHVESTDGTARCAFYEIAYCAMSDLQSAGLVERGRELDYRRPGEHPDVFHNVSAYRLELVTPNPAGRKCPT